MRNVYQFGDLLNVYMYLDTLKISLTDAWIKVNLYRQLLLCCLRNDIKFLGNADYYTDC